MQSEVLYLSPTYGGRVHDKNICGLEGLTFLKEVPVLVDLGFQGMETGKAHLVTPHKRGKGRELTEEQQKHNSWVSKVRVKVEHTIGSVKVFRKVKEKYRGRLYAREDTIMLVACSLHNLKLRVKFL